MPKILISDVLSNLANEVFKRNNIEKSETMPVDKMDANDPKLHYTLERKYTQENRYDRFSVLQGLLPSKEFYSVAMPDYVNINYDFIKYC